MNTTTQTPEPDILRTEIEINTNTVALVKLPMPVKELAGMIEHLEQAHGKELRMTEQPKGWLSFFQPFTTP
jgi:hypothetical protein